MRPSPGGTSGRSAAVAPPRRPAGRAGRAPLRRSERRAGDHPRRARRRAASPRRRGRRARRACGRRQARRRPRRRRRPPRSTRGRSPPPRAWPTATTLVGLAVAAEHGVRRHAALLGDRGDKPVHRPAVLGALPHRDHLGDRAAQAIVDDDPAPHLQAARPSHGDAGPDPDRHDDRVARQLGPVGEAQARHPALRSALDRLGVVLEPHVDAERRERREQPRAGRRVELALHQPVDQVHDGDLRPAGERAAGGLQAEQPAADHGHPRPAARGRAQRVAVFRAAERHHPVELEPGQRRQQRIRAGREGDGGERAAAPVGEAQRRRPRVHAAHPRAGQQLDALVGVPRPAAAATPRRRRRRAAARTAARGRTARPARRTRA